MLTGTAINFLDNTLSLLKVCIKVYNKNTTKKINKYYSRPVRFKYVIRGIFKEDEDQIFQKQNNELIQYCPEIISEDSTFIIIKKDCKLITLLDYYQ